MINTHNMEVIKKNIMTNMKIIRVVIIIVNLKKIVQWEVHVIEERSVSSLLI